MGQASTRFLVKLRPVANILGDDFVRILHSILLSVEAAIPVSWGSLLFTSLFAFALVYNEDGGCCGWILVARKDWTLQGE